ncbi:SusC/RagA family TonB-linked outer membrane protein [Olivibacter sp. 47]|uniref:SusC/RagA family TonB-linked outer membrane protein n=1 Tax=Olivibacter sp. 47 TaxID=3056486 RepID=UPI0025A3F896|nr:SusC/RagA family TonB-linked outer membrane protein [Olivibacter sp. 47]MDM8176408.1 SusC/RagA family TonB-linked outer membrane protein [Olivibacter sp. 47]
MKLFTSYIRELFVLFKLKSSTAVTHERSLVMSGGRRFIISFCNGMMQWVEPLSTTGCIQKINEKTTCNSRVTGKQGLRNIQGAFCWFFAAKNCIKKYWKFAYRFIRCGRNDDARRFLHKVEMTALRNGEMARGSGLSVLKPYTIYLITLKILFCVCLAHARQSSSPEAAHGVALQDVYPITGKVFDGNNNQPLEGATIAIQGSRTRVLTGADGAFRILTADTTGILLITYIGYRPERVPFNRREAGPFIIKLQGDGTQLEEVQVSTGYQTLPKERATGSFVQVDNELLNRRVSTNILDRLDGVTSGLVFDRRAGNNQNINIRGISTIFSDNLPLIVVDNFPYEGALENINPNDIESITVLKDAAAASIWGVRAGNGVIVITTKKGAKGSKRAVSFNANTTVAEKPNLFYEPQMASGSYVEIEEFLFNNGYFDAALRNDFQSVSPVVEALYLNRQGLLGDTETADRLSGFKQTDVRNDLKRYFYRASVNQQYQLSISGGNEHGRYYLSGGYDNNRASRTTDSRDRYTLSFSNSQYFFRNKLELETGLLLTKTVDRNKNQAYSPAYPYDRLADNSGNALPIVNANTLRRSYTDTVGNGQLLDWAYRPLDENIANTLTDVSDYRFNLGLGYNIINGVRLSAAYLYQKGTDDSETENGLNTFFTRNLINSYSQPDASGNIGYAIPLGAILDTRTNKYESKYWRFQLNINRTFNDHGLNAILGYEIRDYDSFTNAYRLYGYNRENQTNANPTINFAERYPLYHNRAATAQIPAETFGSSVHDRYVSIYANASYQYRQRYILSASARKDESNIFGVRSNQKGVPLWSVGLSWLISNEEFFSGDFFNLLKFRATYGYNGNVDKSTSAYLTATGNLTPFNWWNAYNTRVLNPPNPGLSWERVQNINLALDFGLKRDVVSGSVEVFMKNASDLIGNSPIAPQTGIQRFKGNSADMYTRGVDLILNTKNLKGNLEWTSNLLLSTAHNKVTDYKVSQGNNYQIASLNYMNPLEGYPYGAIFSFRYEGLNDSGDPIGYVNGEKTTDYAAILNSLNSSELVYSGSRSPVIYGSLRNNFNWRRFSLSFNITYKLNYSFRNNAIFTGSNYTSRSSVDYDKRWQKPGDELHTHVPALVYPANSRRSNFYQYADIHVLPADHIRLQDVRIAYSLGNGRVGNLGFKRIDISCYLNNLAILWRANKIGIDPDVGTASYPNPKTVSLAIRADF